VRLPLIIATAVLVVVGVLAGVVALGSAAGGDPPNVEPITVQAPAVPAPGGVPPEPAPQPAPRDQEGFVAPPPPVDDDVDDDPGDDPGDGPDDDD
jgi:hypothetical protein